MHIENTTWCYLCTTSSLLFWIQKVSSTVCGPWKQSIDQYCNSITKNGYTTNGKGKISALHGKLLHNQKIKVFQLVWVKTWWFSSESLSFVFLGEKLAIFSLLLQNFLAKSSLVWSSQLPTLSSLSSRTCRGTPSVYLSSGCLEWPFLLWKCLHSLECRCCVWLVMK